MLKGVMVWICIFVGNKKINKKKVMGMFTEPLDENKILRSKVYLLEKKLLIAKRALVDIKKWDNELEDEWGDPGERASDALEKIMILDGF